MSQPLPEFEPETFAGAAAEAAGIDPAQAIAQAMRAFADGPRGNAHAIMDRSLPAIVRGYLAIKQGSATETLAIREAGFMPALYARFEGEPVRVTCVSTLGDVGISRKLDEEYGYFDRVSIYDLTDFSTERPSRQPRPHLHGWRADKVVIDDPHPPAPILVFDTPPSAAAVHAAPSWESILAGLEQPRRTKRGQRRRLRGMPRS